MRRSEHECKCICHIMPSDIKKEYLSTCLCCVECENCGKRIRINAIYRHSYICANNDSELAADLNIKMRMKYADKKWYKDNYYGK